MPPALRSKIGDSIGLMDYVNVKLKQTDCG